MSDIFSENGLCIPRDVFGTSDFSTPESIEFHADMALTRGNPKGIMNVAIEYGAHHGRSIPETTAVLLSNPPNAEEEIEANLMRKRKGKRPDKLRRRK